MLFNSTTMALRWDFIKLNILQVEVCVETLCKYLENIVTHPEEEKYQKIRLSNRWFYLFFVLNYYLS